ncbi:MAG: radical SAM protein [Clostridia bacterium]|nr:radical SAM protein [Clostridia bacterium]
MLNLNRLWRGEGELRAGAADLGDRLRYQAQSQDNPQGTRPGWGPVVVWNLTQRCNLACRHCYAGTEAGAMRPWPGPNTAEARAIIDQLADFRVPVILFSGGEPLTRPDLLELASYAVGRGLHVTISTNGTLITEEMAQAFKEVGIGYVGVSLDGLEATNDFFRGTPGAFAAALEGIRHCLEAGQRVGLRFTLTRYNYADLPGIFALVEAEGIPRVCFYHLVYSGRGSHLREQDLSAAETRRAVDLIWEWAVKGEQSGQEREVLLVDNHADAVYLYLKLKASYPERAERALPLLCRNGGNRSGMAIACIDWEGNVHPDQFTMNHTLGNIKQKPFGEIWSGNHPLLVGLRDRKPRLRGRCGRCRWLFLCNGNFRARAEAATGDFWESDPACYLTDEEIGLKERRGSDDGCEL